MKKFKYIPALVNILSQTRNLMGVLSLYFFPRKITLHLKSGIKFQINNFHNLISINEVFNEEEYKIKGLNPKVIIDVGANIGDSTIYFAKKYPKAVIYAYEPAKSVFKILSKNLEQNNVGNVQTFQLGVGSKKGSVYFYENSKSGLSSLYLKGDTQKRQKINLVTLSQVIKKHKITSCDLLKIDCEGGEFDILLKLKRNIYSHVKNIVVEYHDKITDYQHDKLVAVLRQNKFKVKIKQHKIENDIGIIYATKHNN